MGAYAASKAGVQRLTESLAAELRDRGHHRQRDPARHDRHAAQSRRHAGRGFLALGRAAATLPTSSLFLASDAGVRGDRSGHPGVRARLELSLSAATHAAFAGSRTRHPRRDPSRARPSSSTSKRRREDAAGRQVVDLLAGRQAVRELRDARVVTEHHQVPRVAAELAHHRRASAAGRGEVQPFVLRDAAAADTLSSRAMMRRRRHARAPRGSSASRSGFSLRRAQASRHLRRIALTARFERAIPVLLAGQRPVGLRMPDEREALSFARRTSTTVPSTHARRVACAPARRRAASGPRRCAGRSARRGAGR